MNLWINQMVTFASSKSISPAVRSTANHVWSHSMSVNPFPSLHVSICETVFQLRLLYSQMYKEMWPLQRIALWVEGPLWALFNRRGLAPQANSSLSFQGRVGTKREEGTRPVMWVTDPSCVNCRVTEVMGLIDQQRVLHNEFLIFSKISDNTQQHDQTWSLSQSVGGSDM